MVLQPKLLRLLKEAGVSKDFLAILKALKNQKYAIQRLFMEVLYANGEKALVDKYKLEIFQHTETSGRFNEESYVDF